MNEPISVETPLEAPRPDNRRLGALVVLLLPLVAPIYAATVFALFGAAGTAFHWMCARF